MHLYGGEDEEDINACWKKFGWAKQMPYVAKTASLRRPSPSRPLIGREEEEEEDEDAKDTAGHDARYWKDQEIDSVFQEILTTGSLFHLMASVSLWDDPAALVRCERELAGVMGCWTCVGHVFRPAQRLKMDSVFASLATMIRWGLNETEAALSTALRFVGHAEEWLFSHLPQSQEPVYYILRVLSDTQNDDILQHFISLLEGRDGGTFLSGPLAPFASGRRARWSRSPPVSVYDSIEVNSGISWHEEPEPADACSASQLSGELLERVSNGENPG